MKKVTKKLLTNWRSEIALLDKIWIKEKIKTQSINYLESNEKEDIATKLESLQKLYPEENLSAKMSSLLMNSNCWVGKKVPSFFK